MWGAIIGDLAGSIYEYEQTKEVKTIQIKKIIEENSFYSDDTILTVAILDAILNGKSYEEYLRKYARENMDYKPNAEPYFEKPFSPNFIKWVNKKRIGDSAGNGALMRISPVAYMFDDLEEVKKNAVNATTPSHNSKEAIDSVITLVTIIYLVRKGYNKDQIIKKLNLNPEYEQFKKFNYRCKETLGNCLYAAFTSDSYEESLREVISYGGDTDTNACITGSIAEALYGVPVPLIEQAKLKLPEKYVKMLTKVYQKRI